MLVKRWLVPVEVWGADEGYGLADAIEAWSDCNRADGHIFRIAEEGDTRGIPIMVAESDLPALARMWNDHRSVDGLQISTHVIVGAINTSKEFTEDFVIEVAGEPDPPPLPRGEAVRKYLKLPWSDRWTIMEQMGIKLHTMPFPSQDVAALRKLRDNGQLDEFVRRLQAWGVK